MTLFQRLYALLERLKNAEIPCEVWVDGSFVSEKPSPEDIDLSIMVQSVDYEHLDEPALQLLDDISYCDEKYLGVLDAFVCIYGGDAIDEEIDDPEDYAKLWGIEHNERYLKGFVVLEVS